MLFLILIQFGSISFNFILFLFENNQIKKILNYIAKLKNKLIKLFKSYITV